MRKALWIMIPAIAGTVLAASFVEIMRVDQAPEIDGIPDEEVWQQAVPVSQYFVQHRPDCGDPMTELTEIRLLYDDHTLYASFVMHDSHPEEFTRILAPRDHDCSSEWIGIWLDTFNDDNNAYFFFTNIDNIQQDGRLCEVSGWDMNWDAVWESETACSESGWSAEYAIPLAALRYSDDPDQIWGINFKRTITRTNESAFLYRMGDNGNVEIRNFGELHGLSGLPRSGQLELRPYGAARLQYLRDEEEPWDPWGNLGMDCKMGISSSTSLDLTVNPDFGQIEADPDQVNLSHWETFLREKRPFFLEGADLFQMPFNLFYSRRIGAVDSSGEIIPILGGAKLTGNSQGFRYGILEAFTGKTENGGSLAEPYTNYSVGRILREFGQGTYVGLSLTSTDIPGQDHQEYHFGRSGALDGQLRIGESHTFSGAVGGTWNSVDSVYKDNMAYRGWYGYRDDRLDCSVGFNYREDNFDANMAGYTTSTGEVETWLEGGIYHPFENSRALQHGWLNVYGHYDRVPGGEITSSGISMFTGVVFRNRYHIEGSLGYRGTRFDRYEGPEGREYRDGMTWGFEGSTDSREIFYTYLWINGGTYSNGYRRGLGGWFNLKPMPHFSLGADVDWAETWDTEVYNYDEETWDIRDTDWKSIELSGSYMFSTDLSLSLVSQISRFRSDYALSPATESNNHWMNILLSWQFRPGSIFYFMMGENADPDEYTGEFGDPDFTVFTKLTWFLAI